MLRKGLVFSAFILSSLSPLALGLTVTESADFSRSFSYTSSTHVGKIDTTGISTVSGSLDGRCGPSPWRDIDCNALRQDEQDSFYFTLAEGFRMDNISITTSNFIGPESFTANFTIHSTPHYTAERFQLSMDSNHMNLLTESSFGDIFNGTEFLQGLSVNGGFSDEVGDYSFDYLIEIQISEVPVPAAAWLFASALIGLAGIKRK